MINHCKNFIVKKDRLKLIYDSYFYEIDVDLSKPFLYNLFYVILWLDYNYFVTLSIYYFMFYIILWLEYSSSISNNRYKKIIDSNSINFKVI